MNWSNVHSPKWANAAHTLVDCMVTFEGFGEVPFTASPTDSTEYGPAIFAFIQTGAAGTIADYVSASKAQP